ncbi:MAG: hypothetical protein R2744_05760 [Bacteroidales bacterium]
MIDRIFDRIYEGSVDVYDYFTGEKLDISDVRKMEKQDGFGRENIGKIQFTENWYFDPASLDIRKEVVSIVPGYAYLAGDSTIISYRAAFRLDILPAK